MSQNAGARLTLFVIVFVFLCGAVTTRDLEGIKKKIADERQGLSELKMKEGSVVHSLGKIDRELGKRTRELRQTHTRLKSLAHDIAVKKAEADDLGRSIAARQDVLQKRAVALYRWQRGGNAWSLFDGVQSAPTLLRRNHYLQAALDFDQQLVTGLNAESRRQDAVRQELAQKKQQLDEQQEALSVAKEAVRREAEQKKVLLASLRQEKEARLRALREMEGAALRLQRMLDDIARRRVVKPRQEPSLPSSGVGLDNLRGKLDWPVRGEVIAPFGKFKHPEFAAEIVRKGIDIDAPMGEPIRAVERGRIVFADHFSGYGKMVIIDHGERYYTVYGHLSEILKKNGDEVRRGETLGRVGDSDSLAGSNLYFELRKDGRSMDPLNWLKKR